MFFCVLIDECNILIAKLLHWNFIPVQPFFPKCKNSNKFNTRVNKENVFAFFKSFLLPARKDFVCLMWAERAPTGPGGSGRRGRLRATTAYRKPDERLMKVH